MNKRVIKNHPIDIPFKWHGRTFIPDCHLRIGTRTCMYLDRIDHNNIYYEEIQTNS